MDTVTLSDKSVSEMAQNSFSLLKLDVSKNKNEVNKLGIPVESLPTTLFLNKDGTLIKKIEGYVGPQDFLKEMKNVENPVVMGKNSEEEEKQTVKAESKKLKWLKSFEKGKKEAENQQKVLLVKFGATW